MARIELSEGSWAEVTDVGRLRGKHRSEVQRHIGSSTRIDDSGIVDRTQFGPVMATASIAIIAMLVEKWDLTYEPGADVPFRNPEWLEQIYVEDLNKLDEVTQDHQGKLLLRRTGREPEIVEATGQPDPAGPTSPAVEPSYSSEAGVSPRHSATSSESGTTPSTTSDSSNAGQ